MNLLRVVALLVYTFGAFAYASLLGIALRGLRQAGWKGPDNPAAARTSLVGLGLWSVSFVWFVINLTIVVLQLGPAVKMWPFYLAGNVVAFAFPPLIVHITWAEVMETRPSPPGRLWALPIWPAYALSAAMAIAGTLAFLGIGNLSLDTTGQFVTIGLIAAFIGASLYSMLLISRHPAPGTTARNAQSSRWHVTLFAIMAALFAIVFFVDAGDSAIPLLGASLEIVTKSLPIAFMFVGTYFEHRFEFFDLFIKRGLALFITLAVLVSSFALALPLLRQYDGTWAAPWVYAIAILPIAMILPWLHARVGAFLDRAWLGRRFTTVSAVKHFLSGLRSATAERHLVEQAQTGLAEIFDAPATVMLDSASEATEEGGPGATVEEAEIRSAGRVVGRIVMGPRRNETPYFSEDTALLESLAEVLGSVLDNVRLQQRDQEQNLRARELALHASRSELKALRAQINPHFLFNALNAIAGLIHRDPDLADRTIEKLADVFRYALRGSQGEWAVLEEELEFVRAYLGVEVARFGPRLHVQVVADDDTRAARVPTLVVQTLVENAIKHGAAALKGHATVAIRARRLGGHLLITVADNGPGPTAAADTGHAPRAGGYGLANIRQRLSGHFNGAANLMIERDAARGVTVASITMPFLSEEPRAVEPAGGRS